MLDKAKNLLRPSARSDVPAFMVMDVVAAATRLEAQGRRVIHMEVGQPAAGAPSTAIAAARAGARVGRARLYRDPGHGVVAPAHRAGLRRMARSRYRSGTHRRHHRLFGRIHAGVSCRLRGGRSRGGGVAGLSAVSPHPHRARLRAGRDRNRARPRVGRSPAKPCWRSTAARPLKGVVVASPANPSGTMMTAAALAELIRMRRGCRHCRHLRRNLSRPRLCLCRGMRGAACRRTPSSSIRSPNISA